VNDLFFWNFSLIVAIHEAEQFLLIMFVRRRAALRTRAASWANPIRAETEPYHIARLKGVLGMTAKINSPMAVRVVRRSGAHPDPQAEHPCQQGNVGTHQHDHEMTAAGP
jgi:hypothetical protein